MAEERLQKILARAGIASRRAAEQLITAGRVTVNGKPITELGARADTARDRVELDGRAIEREEHRYYLIHKPRGMVTTMKDPEDRPSLSELLHQIPERVYPVGRLDFHTSGALLLTNDGDLAQALLHPSRAVPKTYVVKVSVPVTESMRGALERGVVLDDGYRTQPARVEHLRDEDGKSWLEITITEGKNRQIHRMIESLGARVMRLSRLSFAGLSTEGLRPTQIRELFPEEIDALRREYLSDQKAEQRQPKRKSTQERMRERLEHMGERTTSSEGRAAHERRAEQERPPSGQRAAQSERPRFSERAAHSERPRFAERVAHSERPGLSERPAQSERPRFAQRVAQSERPRFAERVAQSERPRFGERAQRAGERVHLGEREGERVPRGSDERSRFAERTDARAAPSEGSSSRRASAEREGRARLPEPRASSDRGSHKAHRESRTATRATHDTRNPKRSASAPIWRDPDLDRPEPRVFDATARIPRARDKPQLRSSEPADPSLQRNTRTHNKKPRS